MEKPFLAQGAESNPSNPMGARSDRIVDRTGESSERIDYPSMVFRQIERTVLSLSKGLMSFSVNVDMMEQMIKPYFDNIYFQELSEIEKQIMAIDALTVNEYGERNTQEYNFRLLRAYERKFGALITVLARRGMLPKEDVEVTIGEEETPEEDDPYSITAEEVPELKPEQVNPDEIKEEIIEVTDEIGEPVGENE